MTRRWDGDNFYDWAEQERLGSNYGGAGERAYAESLESLRDLDRGPGERLSPRREYWHDLNGHDLLVWAGECLTDPELEFDQLLDEMRGQQ